MRKLVLVVDDSELVRRTVRKTLESAGYETMVASNGVEALRAIHEHPDVALVICDKNMPVMGGDDLCRVLRLEPLHAHTPVILLSIVAHVDRTPGVTVRLQKPVQGTQLLHLVEHLVQCAPPPMADA